MNRPQTLAAILILISPLSAFAAEKGPQQPWKARMRDLHQAYGKILPDVVDDRRFEDPKRQKEIQREAERLAAIVQGLQPESVGPAGPGDSDPTLGILAAGMKDTATRASAELRRGNRAYARSLLRSLPAYCVSCHSRSVGPDTGPATSAEPLPSFASRIDRGEFLASTRHFDAALDEFEGILANPSGAEGRELEWERAIRHALMIGVRVKRDPERSLRIVDRVLATPTAPRFLRDYAAKWRESILAWKAEKPRTTSTAQGRLAEARRLMAEAAKLQRYPADHSGDIAYLRASSELHDALKAKLDDPSAAESLLLLGLSYDALRDPDLGVMHEVFYETCVRRAPGSEYAPECYRRLEQSVFEDYTGSSGTSIPAEVERHLKQLGDLIPATGPAAAKP